jgi:hypothetical protein
MHLAVWVVFRIELSVSGLSGGFPVTMTTFAIFAIPVFMVRNWSGWWPEVLVALNPFIYGGMWWFAWRMWRLMRRKPE